VAFLPHFADWIVILNDYFSGERKTYGKPIVPMTPENPEFEPGTILEQYCWKAIFLSIATSML